MAAVKPILAGASIAAQIIWFVGFWFLFFDLLSLPNAVFPGQDVSAEDLIPYMVETIDSYRPFLGVGIIGAITAWLLILKGRYWAPWFLSASRVVGWLWMPLIPVGTVLGVLLLSSRSAAISPHGAT